VVESSHWRFGRRKRKAKELWEKRETGIERKKGNIGGVEDGRDRHGVLPTKLRGLSLKKTGEDKKGILGWVEKK